MTCLCFVDLVAFVGTAMLLAAAVADAAAVDVADVAVVVVDAAAVDVADADADADDVADAVVVDAAVDVAEPGKDESSGKNRKIH